MASSTGARLGFVLLVLVFVCLTVFFLSQSITSESSAKAPEPLQSSWYKVETARGEIRKNESIVGNYHI